MFDLIEKLYICEHTGCLDCPDCVYYHACLISELYNNVTSVSEKFYSIHYAEGEI